MSFSSSNGSAGSFSAWDGSEKTGSMDAHAQMERYERQLTTPNTTVGTNGERVHMIHNAQDFSTHVNDNVGFGHQVFWHAGGKGPTMVGPTRNQWHIGNICGEHSFGETRYYTTDRTLFYDLDSAQTYQKQIDAGLPQYLYRK